MNKLSSRKFVSLWLSTDANDTSRARHFEGAPDFRGTIDQAAKFARGWAKKCGVIFGGCGTYAWTKVEGLPAYYTDSLGHGVTALFDAESDLQFKREKPRYA
jgi:hypothetical protein